jgi:hypothetical protein
LKGAEAKKKMLRVRAPSFLHYRFSTKEIVLDTNAVGPLLPCTANLFATLSSADKTAIAILVFLTAVYMLTLSPAPPQEN